MFFIEFSEVILEVRVVVSDYKRVKYVFVGIIRFFYGFVGVIVVYQVIVYGNFFEIVEVLFKYLVFEEVSIVFLYFIIFYCVDLIFLVIF